MMIVVNKNKLKKIITVGIGILLISFFCVTFIKSKHIENTFKFVDTANLPYTQGIKKDSKHVALTCNVDLGWETEYLETILKKLNDETIKITFNVTGRWAEENEELLLKIKSQGHEIGNHGHRHLDYAKLSYEDNYTQIETSKKIIEGIIKEDTKFFQAPAGSFGEGTMKAAKELGYICIKWDVDTIDWMNRQEPEVVIERVKKKNIQENSIILMHPTYATAEAIDDIIKIVIDKGLTPGKLSDIF